MQRRTNDRLRQKGLSHLPRRTYCEEPAVQYELPKWYVSARKRIDHNFTSENFRGIVNTSPSPCGHFIFVVEEYRKSSECDYIYYRGIIYSIKDNREVITLNSSAHKFWHCWVRQSDKLYLLCNEDPQGYTIVDVDEGKASPYIDPKAKDGWGFSWKEVVPSPDGKFLAVQGDYMESVREVALYELSEVPLRKVKRLDANFKSGYLVLKKWSGDKVVMEHMNRGESTTVEVSV